MNSPLIAINPGCIDGSESKAAVDEAFKLWESVELLEDFGLPVEETIPSHVGEAAFLSLGLRDEVKATVFYEHFPALGKVMTRLIEAPVLIPDLPERVVAGLGGVTINFCMPGDRTPTHRDMGSTENRAGYLARVATINGSGRLTAINPTSLEMYSVDSNAGDITEFFNPAQYSMRPEHFAENTSGETRITIGAQLRVPNIR